MYTTVSHSFPILPCASYPPCTLACVSAFASVLMFSILFTFFHPLLLASMLELRYFRLQFCLNALTIGCVESVINFAHFISQVEIFYDLFKLNLFYSSGRENFIIILHKRLKVFFKQLFIFSLTFKSCSIQYHFVFVLLFSDSNVLSIVINLLSSFNLF